MRLTALAAPRAWGALALIALAIALIVTVEPVRLAVHTVLSGLRTTALEVEESETTPAAGLAPSADGTLPPDTFEVTVVEAPVVKPDATGADLDALPFEPVTISPPPDFDRVPARTTLTGGAWNVHVDFEKLQSFLGASELQVPLPATLRAGDLSVRGAAALSTTWTGRSPGDLPLQLVQIAAPRVSGPPELDLELIAEALLHEFLPPVIARGLSPADIPLVREALDLPAPEGVRGPQTFPLPDGRNAVVWQSDGTQLVLIGALDAAALTRLAGAASKL